jgi:hypothetical protein
LQISRLNRRAVVQRFPCGQHAHGFGTLLLRIQRIDFLEILRCEKKCAARQGDTEDKHQNRNNPHGPPYSEVGAPAKARTPH